MNKQNTGEFTEQELLDEVRRRAAGGDVGLKMFLRLAGDESQDLSEGEGELRAETP